MSNLKGTVVHTWSMFVNFPAKFFLFKQPGEVDGNAER